MSDNEDLSINIGSDASGVETGSKAATAAINRVTKEADGLDRAFRALRGSLDPMYAAQTRYNESLANSDRLLAAGRISQEEYAASINAAAAALGRESAAQLKGTQVANQAAEAVKVAARAKAAAQSAADNVIVTSARVSATSRSAEEAKLTAAMALEAKNRAAIVVQEAKARLEAAAAIVASEIPSRNKNDAGKFISKADVAEARAAVEAEAAELLRLAQVDLTVTSGASRNALRVATTREAAAARAVVAEEAAQNAAVKAAEVSAAAAEESAAATMTLVDAQEAAAAAAIQSAQEQIAADALVAKATEEKAIAAGIAAAAEEAAAKATADQAAASKLAEAEAKKLEIAQRRLAESETARVASANRLKAALDPAFAAQMKYNTAVELANKLAVSNPDIVTEEIRVKAVATAHTELEKALNGGTLAKVNNRVITEGLVVAHEGLENRFTRMRGSLVILAQAMMGEEAASTAVRFALSPVGLALIALTAIIGTTIVSTLLYNEAQRKLLLSTLGVGAASGISAGQINKLATSNLDFKSSIKDNIAALQAYTAAGVRSEQGLADLMSTTDDYAALTGQKTKEAVKALAEAMKDPAKGAKDLNDQLSFLDGTQLQEIETLSNMGEKYKAQALLSKELKAHDDEASDSVGGLQSRMHQIGVVFSDVFTALGSLNARMQEFNNLAMFGADAVEAEANRLRALQAIAKDKKDSALGLALNQETSEGKDQTGREKLSGGVTDLQRAITADIKLHGENSDAVRRDRQSLLEYQDTVNRVTDVDKLYHNELQRRTGLMNLQAQLATAKHAHNKAEVEDLGTQIFALKHYNELASDADLKAADAAAGGLAGAKMRPAKGGPNAVAEWAQELHDQEILSKDYFKNEEDDELDFWTKKLTQTTVHGREWLEIQAKIYTISKKQARDDYSDQIADFKDRLDAAKGNLVVEQGIWAEYVTYVKDKMGETSKEAKEVERAFRDATDKMAQFENKLAAGREKAAEGPVTRKFDAAQSAVQTRQDQISSQHSGGGITDTSAAEQQRALVAQEIALEEQKETAISAMQIAELENEKRRQGLMPETIAGIQTKIEEATQQHETKLQEIRTKGILAYQKANEAVATASMEKWKTTADAITSSMGSSLSGLINRTTSWKQAEASILSSVTGAWANMAAKNVNIRLTSLIQQRALHMAHASAEAAITAASQAGQTAATAAGTTARAGLENTSSGIVKAIKTVMTFFHIGQETTKTAATGIGAAARGTEETAAMAAAALAQKPIVAAQMARAAAMAGANGVASFALAPWPLDTMAPEFGAAMAAAAAGYGVAATAYGGQGEVPKDGQITELHKKEMVLPAVFATPLRQMLTKSGSSGMFHSAAERGGQARSSAAGDTHHHHYSNSVQVTAVDAKGVQRFFDQHSDKLFNTMNAGLRGGNKLATG